MSSTTTRPLMPSSLPQPHLPVPLAASTVYLRGNVLYPPVLLPTPANLVFNTTSPGVPIVIAGSTTATTGTGTFQSPAALLQYLGGANHVQAGDFLRLSLTNYSTCAITISFPGANGSVPAQGTNSSYTIPAAVSATQASTLRVLICFVNTTTGYEAYTTYQQTSTF